MNELSHLWLPRAEVDSVPAGRSAAILVPRFLSGLNQILVLIRSGTLGQRWGVVRMEILDFLCLPPQPVSLPPRFPESHPICVPPPATPTHLWGWIMSMCLHRPHPRCLLVQAEHCDMYSSRLVLQPWVSIAVSLFLFLFLALFPGID